MYYLLQDEAMGLKATTVLCKELKCPFTTQNFYCFFLLASIIVLIILCIIICRLSP